MTELTDAEDAFTRDYAAYVVARVVYADAKKAARSAYYAAVDRYTDSDAARERARANAKEGDR